MANQQDNFRRSEDQRWYVMNLVTNLVVLSVKVLHHSIHRNVLTCRYECVKHLQCYLFFISYFFLVCFFFFRIVRLLSQTWNPQFLLEWVEKYFWVLIEREFLLLWKLFYYEYTSFIFFTGKLRLVLAVHFL